MDKLEAGRLLDERIAREVMDLQIIGWGTAYHLEGEWGVALGESPDNHCFYHEHAPLFLDICSCEAIASDLDFEKFPGAYGPKLNDHYGTCLNVVPHYSSDIGAAMEILDHWQGDYLIRRQNTAFRCELYLPSREYREWGQTLPLAICLAALKYAAVSQEEKV